MMEPFSPFSLPFRSIICGKQKSGRCFVCLRLSDRSCSRESVGWAGLTIDGWQLSFNRPYTTRRVVISHDNDVAPSYNNNKPKRKRRKPSVRSWTSSHIFSSGSPAVIILYTVNTLDWKNISSRLYKNKRKKRKTAILDGPSLRKTIAASARLSLRKLGTERSPRSNTAASAELRGTD